MVGVRQLQHRLQTLLDLLFPPHCAACQRGGHILCPTCLALIQPLSPLCCQVCGSPDGLQAICLHCLHHPLQVSGTRSVALFAGPLRACIHALKYKGCTRIAEPLGLLLAQAYQRYGMQADLVIPVPLHSEREQQRGYNQSLLLARVCAAQLALPIWPDALQRIRATPSQVGLHTIERRQNVQGAFLCPTPYTGVLVQRSILLIDDVSTTGATLEACAEPLFAAGARAVWGLVLARPYSSTT